LDSWPVPSAGSLSRDHLSADPLQDKRPPSYRSGTGEKPCSRLGVFKPIRTNALHAADHGKAETVHQNHSWRNGLTWIAYQHRMTQPLATPLIGDSYNAAGGHMALGGLTASAMLSGC